MLLKFCIETSLSIIGGIDFNKGIWTENPACHFLYVFSLINSYTLSLSYLFSWVNVLFGLAKDLIIAKSGQ